MKIIKKQELHKAKAWFTKCDVCGSEIRLLEGQGDPQVSRLYHNCDSKRSVLYWICPVCDNLQKARFDRYEHFITDKQARIEEIVLTEEDRKEIEGFAGKEPDERLKNVNPYI